MFGAAEAGGGAWVAGSWLGAGTMSTPSFLPEVMSSVAAASGGAMLGVASAVSPFAAVILRSGLPWFFSVDRRTFCRRWSWLRGVEGGDAWRCGG